MPPVSQTGEWIVSQITQAVADVRADLRQVRDEVRETRLDLRDHVQTSGKYQVEWAGRVEALESAHRSAARRRSRVRKIAMAAVIAAVTTCVTAWVGRAVGRGTKPAGAAVMGPRDASTS